ncbi:hypothetical protein OHA71_23845 [Streptomyces sp. NBC_00444]|uniref:hypothetical protein n=1 Tax=Streptomyces sp. NBC_00444 TaxID=2975744 RepID=UPI002E235C95
MALPPLATEEELLAYPGVPPGTPSATAQLALRLASGAIRRETKQTITFVENETVLLEGGQQVLALPQRPVFVDDSHPLTVVEIPDGTGIEVPAVENRDFIRLGAELRRGQPLYDLTRYMGWPYNRPLGIWADRVRVLYSHGFQEVPDEIVGVCLDLAAATLANPKRLRSEAAGQTSVTYTVETFGTGSLTSDHRRILRDFRRNAFSVTQS